MLASVIVATSAVRRAGDGLAGRRSREAFAVTSALSSGTGQRPLDGTPVAQPALPPPCARHPWLDLGRIRIVYKRLPATCSGASSARALSTGGTSFAYSL